MAQSHFGSPCQHSQTVSVTPAPSLQHKSANPCRLHTHLFIFLVSLVWYWSQQNAKIRPINQARVSSQSGFKSNTSQMYRISVKHTSFITVWCHLSLLLLIIIRSVIVEDFKPPATHVSCVQDAVSLFGSQEEGELGSAARHLSCVGKVCGQRPNGEERRINSKLNKQRAVCLCTHRLTLSDVVLLFRVTRCLLSKRTSWKVCDCLLASGLQAKHQ